MNYSISLNFNPNTITPHTGEISLPQIAKSNYKDSFRTKFKSWITNPVSTVRHHVVAGDSLTESLLSQKGEILKEKEELEDIEGFFTKNPFATEEFLFAMQKQNEKSLQNINNALIQHFTKLAKNKTTNLLI